MDEWSQTGRKRISLHSRSFIQKSDRYGTIWENSDGSWYFYPAVALSLT